MASSLSSSRLAWVRAFTQDLHQPAGERERLQRGSELAVQLLEGCAHAGVTTTTAASTETTAATDAVVRQGDAWQYELGEGPCLDAAREGGTVLSNDLLADGYWPTWGARVVRELGVRGMLSVALHAGRHRMGALNLYADQAGSWDEDQLARAQVMGSLLACAAADAREIEHRTRAMVSRTTIGQAQGLLMERFGIDAERAFDVLRRVSQNEHRPLATVADELVQTRAFPVDPSGRRSLAGEVDRGTQG